MAEQEEEEQGTESNFDEENHKQNNRRKMKELQEMQNHVLTHNNENSEGSQKAKKLNNYFTHEKLKNAEGLQMGVIGTTKKNKKKIPEEAQKGLMDEVRQGEIHDNGTQKPSKKQSRDGDHEFTVKAGRSTRSMFAEGFEERHDLEQYFWSQKTVMQLKEALKQTAWHTENGHVCCLAAPSLAHAFYTEEGRIEALLDIDIRFSYLPGFHFFDLRNPLASECTEDDFRIVVFDPPFFYIPLPVLFQAVLVAVHGNLQTKLLVGFLRREEGALLQTFAPFRLRRTRFVLEYATVKPNKWRNYALYANVDLPGIKRIA